jgi:general secretion pathway protein C
MTARAPDWSRIARWLANILLVALVIYLAVSMARITWLVVWSQPPGDLARASASSSVAVNSGVSLSAFELFGERPGNEPLAEVVRQSAPETNLRLRLEGVMVSEQSGLSGAIVAGTDGVTAHYRVGEVLPGNVELVEVEASRILIKRNGRFETLTFEESQSDELITEQQAISVSSPDDFVDQARARLDSQGVSALESFGLQPDEDGAGYRFDGSNPVLRSLSLEAGDVITAINGQTLGDLEQDRQLLESWRSQGQIEIEIDRGGARFTVSYALPQ